MRYRLSCSAALALMLVGAAWAAPVTLGKPGGLQATLVGEGPADPRLTAAGSNPPGHFLHPLQIGSGQIGSGQTGSGKILTELYPADHIHHRGLFWGWRQVLLNGKPIANNWLMQGMTIGQTAAVPTADGGIASTAMWRVDGRDILEERLTARIEGNWLDILVELRPKVPGLSLGGSPDDKEYGGISLRLVHSDRLNFESGGRAVSAAVAPVEAGRTMRMTWDAGVDAPARSVTLSCTVDGRPISRWILRRESSMQNCVWPGRTPVPLSMQQPVRLGATLLVEP